MITLSKAFRLCDVDDQVVYLRHKNARPREYVLVTSRIVRERLDMKQVKVLRIIPHFTFDGYGGQEFIVTGISDKEIQKLRWV